MNIYYDVEDNHYRTYPDGDIATIDQMRELIEDKNLSVVKLQQENKHLDGVNCKLRRKIGQLEDNQVRTLNKIRDFINNANCELQESKYSNDNHGLYWELFRKDLTNIQKLIKGINTDEYVTIPKYREKELLNLEDNWNNLKEYLHNADVVADYSENYDGHFINYDELIDKMREIEGGDSNVKD